jgi:putative FmdB family regulatory protein
MIYDFECKKCGHVQEHMVKMGEHTKERCKKCAASPNQLKRLLSAHATMKQNWSKWKI